MAPKKQSSSSSSSRHNHAHNPHRGPDHHHHQDLEDDDVEDSGRDTLKPLLSSRDRESSRRGHGHGHGRSSRGGGGTGGGHRHLHRHHSREKERSGRSSSSRRDDGRGNDHGNANHNANHNDHGSTGEQGGLGRFITKKSKNRSRETYNDEQQQQQQQQQQEGGITAESSEFQELLADQTSVACSTITPPSVFRDMDDGLDDDDDITDEGGRRLVQGSGYANYRVDGVHQRNAGSHPPANPPPPPDDDHRRNKNASSSLRRFGYAGFRKNAARRNNTVNSRDRRDHVVNPGIWNSLDRTLAANSHSGGGTVASAIHSAKLASASATTGAMYRSADATHRALEELKRKKAEAREKRRAVVMLCALLCLALGVHFAGRVGRRNAAEGAGEDGSGNLKGGSKEKKYGNTKELGYGGERAAVAGGARGVGQYNLDAYNGNNNNNGEDGEGEDDYEALPPPVEKIYDEEHQYLLPLRHFADFKDPHRPTDTAFFFHVPRSGGSTLKDMVGKCLKLVQSSEVGVRDGHGADPILQVIEINESKYVNVDTTTVQGIQRAVDLGLSTSGYADLIVSSYLHQSASLFDLHHQARAFLLLRNPVERATSMYYHRVHELGDLDPDVSIEDFAQGNGIENNWMTRFLTDRMEGELTKADLEQAKEILKVKFLIGFIDDIEESIYRFMKYNRWKYAEDENQKMKEEDCIRDLAMVGSNINPNEYELPKRGTQAYALITWQTQFDTKLYEYGKELFDLQTKTYGSKERKKIMKKQKKKGGKL